MKKFCAGIHVLVQRGTKYLVLQKSENDDDDPGCWDLPGGGIEFGEQPLAAAVREAREEAGVDIKIIKLLAALALPNKNSWSVEIVALGKYITGKIRLSKEHSNYKWISKKELHTIKPKSAYIKFLLKNI